MAQMQVVVGKGGPVGLLLQEQFNWGKGHGVQRRRRIRETFNREDQQGLAKARGKSDFRILACRPERPTDGIHRVGRWNRTGSGEEDHELGMDVVGGGAS